MAAFIFALMLLLPALGQDIATADPAHYKILLDNQQVRTLRVHYGPHERSAAHDNSGGVLVLLTDAHLKYTLTDGTVRVMKGLAGEVFWPPLGKAAVENVSDVPLDAVLVETKCAAKPTTK
jgi:hypothetical protein